MRISININDSNVGLTVTRDDMLDDPCSTGAGNLDVETLTETFAPLEDLTSSRAARKPSGFVYLACPYTHDDPKVQRKRADSATAIAAKMMTMGLVVFSPLTHGHQIEKALFADEMDHSAWMAQCLPFLSLADTLYVLQLPGWTLSKGVEIEMEYAKRHGIPIEFLSTTE